MQEKQITTIQSPFSLWCLYVWSTPGKLEKQILCDIENSLLQGVRFMQNAKKIEVACDKSGPSVFTENDIYKINLIEARARGVKLRYISNMTKIICTIVKACNE